MSLASLRSTRRVLRLGGSDVLHFLQGLTTNDVFALSKAPSLYSAFLSPQGRILSDVFFHREEEQGVSDGGGGRGEAASAATSPPPPSLFAEVDASVAPQILSLLRRYRLRSRVDIDDVGEDYEVVVKGFFRGGGGGGGGGGGEGAEEEEASWPRDPRGLRALGLRAVLPSSAAAACPSSASSSSPSSSSPSSSSYAAARYALGVAEGAELEPGRGTPLEGNLDGLRGVCFTKGCYVGQELVARAHFRGQVHKRVMPVRVVEGGRGGRGGGSGGKGGSSSSSLIGRDVVVAADAASPSSSPPTKPARSAGRLLALCRESGTGLALMRLSSVQVLLAPGNSNGGEAPRLALAPPRERDDGGEAGSGLVLLPSRPEWWHEEWGLE